MLSFEFGLLWPAFTGRFGEVFGGAAAPSATLKTLLVIFGLAILVVVPSIGLLFTLVQRNLVEEASQPARERGETSQATP